MNKIKQHFNKFKPIIDSRITEFCNVWKNYSEKDIFAELCFCLCTPQSKAKLAWQAILKLKNNQVLFNGEMQEIRQYMQGVRFPNNKSKFIYEARDLFRKNDKFEVRDKIDVKNIKETRNWFVNNVKGIGYKEASHFLRNIGQGKYLVILDKHILKNMEKYKIIEAIPKTITKKKYLLLENKLSDFAKEIDIELDKLDLVFWSMETGEVFK